jgi:hypothetical protein
MSFKCQNCGTSQEAGEKPHVTVVQQRNKVYPMREEGEGYDRVIVDQGGRGLETVKELSLCEKCADKALKAGVQIVK